MSRSLVLVLLAGASALAEPLIIAAPGLTLVDLDQTRGEFYLDHLASSMSSSELRLVTKKEIATLLGLERQKELLGCADSRSSCVAELGAALGARAVLVGGVAHVGRRYQVSLKVISATDGAPYSVQSGRAESEEALLDLLAQLGRSAAAETLTRLGRKPPAAGVTVTGEGHGGSPRRWSWVPAAAGAISVGVGVGFLVDAANTGGPLTTGTFTFEDATRRRDAANGKQTTGAVLIGVGVAALAGGIGMYLFGGESTPKVSLLVTPSGAQVGLVGALP